MGKYDQSITDIMNIEWNAIKKLIDTLDRDVMEQIIELLLRFKALLMASVSSSLSFPEAPKSVTL